jgi:hypothetical protein
MWQTPAVDVTGRLAITWRRWTARVFSELLCCRGHCATDGLSAVGNPVLTTYPKTMLWTEALHSDRLPTAAWAAVCEISG